MAEAAQNVADSGTTLRRSGRRAHYFQSLYVVIGAVIACAALWFFFWVYSSNLSEVAIERSRRDTGNLAIAFEQNLLGLFNSADQQLLSVKRRYEQDPNGFDLDRALQDSQIAQPGNLRFGLASQNGDVIAMNDAKTPTRLNIADRPHFSVHTTSDAGSPSFSAPIVDRLSGKTSIEMSRRLNDRSGNFAGIVFAVLEPMEITRFFGGIDLGSGAVIMLVGEDGVVRVRASDSGAVALENKVLDAFIPLLKGPRTGVYVDTDPGSGTKCVLSYRAVGRYPLFVLVGMSMEDLLLTPGKQIRAAALAGAIATVLIAVLCYLLLQNIARRRQFEETMQAEARRYQDFTRSASEWQWETDAEGRFIWFSDSAQSMTGIDIRLMLGRRREEFAVDIDDPAWSAYREAVADRKPFKDFVVERNRVTGGRWYIRSSGVPIFEDDGTFRGYRGISSDVTRSEKAMMELRNTEARLRVLTSNLPGIVHQTRRRVGGGEFAYTYLSGRVTEYFGCTAEEAYADPGRMHAAIHPGDMPGVAERMGSAPEEGEIRFWDYRVIANGGIRWLRGIAHFRLDETNKDWLLGDGVVIDITELKEREEETLVAREQAEAADRAKTSFLAHVSHELRTPLNAIMGYAEVIRDRLFGPNDTRYPGYAAHIYDSGAHLLAIINDLLDLSRIDAGKVELDDADVPVRALMADCLALVRAQAANKGVRLIESIEVDGSLRADRRRLTQAALNILANAVKFAPPDGKVAIAVQLQPEGELTILIEDNGPGMSDEDLRHAFEPFRRGDATIRQGAEGTGLGLPICKRLMEIHDGAVAIHSRSGEGVTVTLTLPAHRCRAIIAPTASAAKQRQAK